MLCLPIFVVKVALVKLPNKLFEFLFRVLEVHAVFVGVVHRKIVREEHSRIVKTFHVIAIVEFKKPDGKYSGSTSMTPHRTPNSVSAGNF